MAISILFRSHGQCAFGDCHVGRYVPPRNDTRSKGKSLSLPLRGNGLPFPKGREERPAPKMLRPFFMASSMTRGRVTFIKIASSAGGLRNDKNGRIAEKIPLSGAPSTTAPLATLLSPHPPAADSRTSPFSKGEEYHVARPSSRMRGACHPPEADSGWNC